MITDLLVGPSILMYHSIVDSSDDPYAVSVAAFREQIRRLSEHRFEVVPLSTLVPAIQTQSYWNLRPISCGSCHRLQGSTNLRAIESV